jgi:alpha(1,3/1,4) fucosyltransferase
MKINFVDFWPNFLKHDNYFFRLLSQKYKVEIDEVDPDIVFMSCFGVDKLKYANHRCKKIFFSGENSELKREQFEYDLTLTFDETSGKNIYLPLFILFINWFDVPYDPHRDISYLADLNELLEPLEDSKKLLQTKTNGCCFLAKNPSAKERVQFCQEAQKQFKVDCAGPVLNNYPEIGGRGDQIEKIDFIRSYRSTIAFENSKHPGYLTEKALHGFCTRCVPVYWGANAIFRYFNNNYIWVVGESDWPEAIQQTKRIIESDDEYLEMVSRPAMRRTVLDEFSPERILGFIS